MLFNDTFIHHCEILPQGFQSCYSNYRNCKTNPGHKGFMPVGTFKSELLNPFHEKFTFPEKDYIQLMIDSTVKITLDYTSTARPDTFPLCKMRYPCIEYRGRRGVPRSGTGYLPFYDMKEVQGDSCPCHLCKTSDTPQQTYWEIPVSTATHVVFDVEEAKSALVELFYDSESRGGVRYLYGVNVYGGWNGRYNTDYCVLQCVTHEADLVGTLKRMMEQKKQFKGMHAPTGIMISHPHGMSKMVSLGCVDQKCFIPDSDALLDSLLQHMEEIDIFSPEDDARAPLQADGGLCGDYFEKWHVGKYPFTYKVDRTGITTVRIITRCGDNNILSVYWTIANAEYLLGPLPKGKQIFQGHWLRQKIDRLLAHSTDKEEFISFLYDIRLKRNVYDNVDLQYVKCVLQLILKLLDRSDCLDPAACLFYSTPFLGVCDATVLPLPGGSPAILPRHPLVHLRRHFFGDKCFWGTISPVTLFSQPRNQIVQSELVFYVPVEAEKKISFTCFSSLSYSMPACPGCSGARVSAQFCPTDCDTVTLFGHNHHFGYDGEQSLSGRVREGHVTLRDIKNYRIKLWI